MDPSSDWFSAVMVYDDGSGNVKSDNTIIGAGFFTTGDVYVGSILLGVDASKFIKWGSGAPEGFVTASIGAVWIDYTNGNWYLKTSGTGNTGWTLK